MRKVVITISPAGEKKVEAVGYSGASCETATKPFCKGRVLQEVKKPEYYETERGNQECRNSW